MSRAEVERALDRPQKDRTTGRVLDKLVKEGVLQRGEDRRYSPTQNAINDDYEEQR